MKDENAVPEIPSTAFAKKGACAACGATNWAHARLNAKTYRPDTCDRCPPKPAEKMIHEAGGKVE